jgi:hypothetical protein
MAIIAVVLAFLPMCVPLNLVGCVLGALAKRRIAASGGALGGRGAATAAIWGGIIMTAAGWWAFVSLTDWAEGMVQRQASSAAAAFVHDVQQGDYEAAAGWWSPSVETPNTAAMAHFAEAIAAFGEVDGVGVRVMQPLPGDTLTPVWSAGLVFNFGSGPVSGSARYDVLMGVSTVEEMVLLRRIVIEGPEGDVVLPESP